MYISRRSFLLQNARSKMEFQTYDIIIALSMSSFGNYYTSNTSLMLTNMKYQAYWVLVLLSFKQNEKLFQPKTSTNVQVS